MRFYQIPLVAAVICCTNCQPEKSAENNPATGDQSEETNNGNITIYPNKQVFWGNTHLHTSLSGDAFGAGTRLDAEDALRLAIGEKIKSNTGQDVQLERPLDFLAITDHAEGFGVFDEIAKGNEVLMADPVAKRWYDDPGVFTALQAYEWTSVPTGNNLHRNVIFRDGKNKVDSILPFSALQSVPPVANEISGV